MRLGIRHVLVGGALLLTLSSAGLISARRHLDRQRWDAAIEIADRWQAEADAINSTRPVLWGEPIEREAWPHYMLAIRESWDAVTSLSSQQKAFLGKTAPERLAEPLFLEMLAKLEPSLERVREGARCTQGRHAVHWAEGCSGKIPSLLGSRLLVMCMLATADQHLAANEPAIAAGLVLDCLQFGRDMTDSPVAIPQAIGPCLIEVTCDWFAESGPWSSLGEAEFMRLQVALEELELWPSGGPSLLATEGLLLVREFQKRGPGRHAEVTQLPGAAFWRYGGSFPAVLLDFAEEIDAIDKPLRALGLRPLSVDVDRLFRPIKISQNPLQQSWSVSGTKSCMVDSRSRSDALLELLRTAVAVRLGQTPTLRHPDVTVTPDTGSTWVQLKFSRKTLEFEIPGPRR